MTELTNQPDSSEQGKEVKKVSLAEAAKQKLAQKKQAQSNAKGKQKHQPVGNQTMKSQQAKKTTLSSRKMGV